MAYWLKVSGEFLYERYSMDFVVVHCRTGNIFPIIFSRMDIVGNKSLIV